MGNPQNVQLLSLKRNALQRDIAAFITDRKAQGFAPKTIAFYRSELALWADYLANRHIADIPQITPTHIREYLLHQAERRKPASVHCSYRAIRAFLRWYETEYEPADWANPIRRVRPPKLPQEVLQPADLEHVKAMLATCRRRTFTDIRDKAILLCLLDTGLRAAEFLNLDAQDVNLETGTLIVRRGKGGKFRTAFLGRKATRAVLDYIRRCTQGDGPLWLTTSGERLTYWGLRQILRRRAGWAGVPMPTAHSFRRAFALLALRRGLDLVSLQKLLGHADLSVIRRYLAQTEADLREAHARASPVDGWL